MNSSRPKDDCQVAKCGGWNTLVDYDIQYIKGTSNKVADSLSRYYQSDTEGDMHPTYDYVNADIQLDPEGEDLPWNRVIELRAITDDSRERLLREATEERGVQAEDLANANRAPRPTEDTQIEGDNPTIYESISDGPELRKHVEEASDFLDKVRMGYGKDKLLSKVVEEKE